MKIYNKTTTEKKYGNNRFQIKLPPSISDGVRGPAVEVSIVQRVALSTEWERAQADLENGEIDVEA